MHTNDPGKTHAIAPLPCFVPLLFVVLGLLSACANRGVEVASVNAEEIQSLVGQIDADIAALKLTSPEADNANFKLKTLAALDRNNPAIESRRDKIRDLYVAWIDKEIQRNNQGKAQRYLASLEQVPGSTSVATPMRQKIASKWNLDLTPRQTAASTAAATDDECKPSPPFLARVSGTTKVTHTTYKRNSKPVPNGSTRTVDLNKEFYVYTNWRNLGLKEYNFKLQLFDDSGERVYSGVNILESRNVATDRWTMWVNYRSTGKEVPGTWTYIVCTGGYKQLEKKFRTQR